MILGFADKETEKVFYQAFSKRLPPEIQRQALFKLMVIDGAESLNELRVPPSNHLEQLHGLREGQYSIRINRQFRICFTVCENGFNKVSDFLRAAQVNFLTVICK